MRKISYFAAIMFSSIAHAGPTVFTCEPEWASLVHELVGTEVTVYSATTAQQDPHQIQARPSLIAAYRNADLLVCTGAGLELGWLPALAQKANNPRVLPGKPGYLEVSSLVDMLEVPESVDRSLGDVHPQGNPHIQLNPAHMPKAAAEIASRLSTIDPEHADAYEARRQVFETRWVDALVKWNLHAAPLRGISVVSSHRAFPYLYAWLGMHEVATLEPKPGVPPGAAHLNAVLAQLQQTPARMVIYAAYQSDRPAKWLAEKAKIPAVKLPFSPGGMAGSEDLFGLFEVTLSQLLSGLGVAP